jgi:CRISPR-associated protein Cst2
MKRDSVLRMNLAKAIYPYRHNAVFTQSPEIKDSPWKPGGGDSRATSALLHRETVVSGFQYPFALAQADCKPKVEWTKRLLQAIGELSDVAGNHARSYFEMAPASIIARLTTQLVAGYQTYCFKPKGHGPQDEIPDVILDILAGDFDDEIEREGKKVKGPDGKNLTRATEFHIGGEIVKRVLTDKQIENLRSRGVTLDRDPRRLIATVADKFLGGK